jgi:TRAP-type C4-dicarboxylate transport system permease small subunit
VRRLGDHLEEGACVLIFGVMTVVALVNVVTRYVIRYSLAFTEEIVVSLFVWLTLLGTAIAFRQGSHLAFTYLVERAPPPLHRLALALSTALSVGLFLALAWFGLGQIRSERMLGTTSEALAIPQWWYTAGIPVLSLLIVVRILQSAWDAARRAGRPDG